MAIYQPVHVKVWDDNWFQDMKPTGKLVFLFLLTCPSNNPSGIFRCTTKTIGFNCGLSVRQVDDALAGMSGHVEYDPERVTVAALHEAIKGAGYRSEGAKTRFKIDGITCASCITRIESALKETPGVTSSVTPLLTIFFASLGSSNWSQIATL